MYLHGAHLYRTQYLYCEQVKFKFLVWSKVTQSLGIAVFLPSSTFKLSNISVRWLALLVSREELTAAVDLNTFSTFKVCEENWRHNISFKNHLESVSCHSLFLVQEFRGVGKITILRNRKNYRRQNFYTSDEYNVRILKLNPEIITINYSHLAVVCQTLHFKSTRRCFWFMCLYSPLNTKKCFT